jgi:hypothetical protein
MNGIGIVVQLVTDNFRAHRGFNVAGWLLVCIRIVTSRFACIQAFTVSAFTATLSITLLSMT